jgi:hypothetical protein
VPTAARRKADTAFTTTISNVGTVPATVGSSMLVSRVNNASVVSCDAFSRTLAPGASLKVRCLANIAGLGLSSGQPYTATATLTVPLEMSGSNNVSTRSGVLR